MTLITQIEDKGAVVAWSPIGEYADVIALGSKVRSIISSFSISSEKECYFILFCWYSANYIFIAPPLSFQSYQYNALQNIHTINRKRAALALTTTAEN